MKVDIYGRLRLEIVREGERWAAYKLEPGKRLRLDDLVIPGWLSEADVIQHLDDHYHEAARPGQVVRLVQE
ncbi:MAG TPA: hypothetical protein VLJ84_13905 [Usitatibacter sp.]|nr:hypothetical protein [Usitatibacter sp.]